MDGEGREIFLPYIANENSATGTNAPIDPKNFIGKTVTVVCKGRDAGLNPRTGKKNVMISSIESIKEGAATVPAKP